MTNGRTFRAHAFLYEHPLKAQKQFICNYKHKNADTTVLTVTSICETLISNYISSIDEYLGKHN